MAPSLLNPFLRRLAFVALAIAASLRAELVLPAFLGDGAILQRGQPINLSGADQPGQRVTLVFAPGTFTAVTAADGRWQIALPPLTAGGPHTLVFTGSTTRTVADVLIGEVWLASGQSNMVWPVRDATEREALLAAADTRPAVRILTVPVRWADAPLADTDLGGAWTPAPAIRARPGDTSAVALAFALRLENALGVPVGVVVSAVNGSPIQSWFPREKMPGSPFARDGVSWERQRHDPGFCQTLEEFYRHRQARRDALVKKDPAPPREPVNPTYLPGASHHAMIAPLDHFPVAGILWYQGEANVTDGPRYATKLSALLAEWRAARARADLPLLLAKLAPYDYTRNPTAELPAFWAAQDDFVRTNQHTGAITVHDLVDDTANIHPPRKQEVGERFADLALRLVYQIKDTPPPPTLRSAALRGDEVVLSFDPPGLVLSTRDGAAPAEFGLAADTGDFVPVAARIEADTVSLTVPAGLRPARVRLGLVNTSRPNLTDDATRPVPAFTAPVAP